MKKLRPRELKPLGPDHVAWEWRLGEAGPGSGGSRTVVKKVFLKPSCLGTGASEGAASGLGDEDSRLFGLQSSGETSRRSAPARWNEICVASAYHMVDSKQDDSAYK